MVVDNHTNPVAPPVFCDGRALQQDFDIQVGIARQNDSLGLLTRLSDSLGPTVRDQNGWIHQDGVGRVKRCDSFNRVGWRNRFDLVGSDADTSRAANMDAAAVVIRGADLI